MKEAIIWQKKIKRLYLEGAKTRKDDNLYII